MKFGALQDHIYRGQGMIARKIGTWSHAFRPGEPAHPLALKNRVLRLPAQFDLLPGNTGGDALERIFWSGIFDGSYTKPGDYILSEERIFFIASQEPFQPIICVRTNRTVSITRTLPATIGSTSSYDGYTQSNTISLINTFPVAIEIQTKSAVPSANLPSDITVPFWVVYMPSITGVSPAAGDLITDDLGRSANISRIDSNYSGWRITAKPATT